MTYNFGRSITRQLFPTEGDEPISLPSQSPSIYLFTEMPSLEDAAAGTGAFSTISYWTHALTEPYPRTYSIPPIYDPEPTGSTPSRGYWEAINYVHAAGGQTRTLLRQFDVERGEALDSQPGTTRQDVIDAYPAITNYLSEPQIDEFISIALVLLKVDLEASGMRWSRIKDLHKTKLALTFRTIAEGSLSQVKDPNDRFAFRAAEYERKYKNILSKITLPYDKDGDGEAESEGKPVNKAWYITR
jgi:hypothetical protein